MLRYPGFDPIAFRIGPVKVHWYGIMYLLGFAGGWWLARMRAAKRGSTWKAADVDDLIFFTMLGVILGGRIGYILFYGLKFWASDPWYPLKVWEGGMSFHGGLIGVVAAMTLFAWRRGRNAADVYDFTAPLPALGLFFGRIGNFINAELYGRPSAVPWAMIFPTDPTHLPRHPSQLYEAVGEGIIVAAIVWWVDVRSHARGWYRPGTLTATFLMAYGVVRFGLEFTRQPDAQLGFMLGPLSMGQLLCLAMIMLGVAVAVWTDRRRGEPFVG
jgi:phosphatidylglycerol:prolipoprotein diacylglycerol transferase